MNFQYFLLILIRERLQIKTVKGVYFILAMNSFLYHFIMITYLNKERNNAFKKHFLRFDRKILNK